MTIAIAWVRKVKNCEELIFASDSRLRGAEVIDCCAKIFVMPRSDCLLCFAGSTGTAYPISFQLASGISSFKKSWTRAMDLHDLKGYLLNICNTMLNSYSTQTGEIPDCTFIFGGYSWIEKSFSLWKIYYEKRIKKFVASKAKEPYGVKGQLQIAGDKEYVEILKQKLRSIAKDKRKSNVNYWDMEPFSCLCEMIEYSDVNSYIGGIPQLAKVYQHMNARMFGVYWPRKGLENQKIAVQGRILMDFETIENWIYDPKTGMSDNMVYSQNNEPFKG